MGRPVIPVLPNSLRQRDLMSAANILPDQEEIGLIAGASLEEIGLLAGASLDMASVFPSATWHYLESVTRGT